MLLFFSHQVLFTLCYISNFIFKPFKQFCLPQNTVPWTQLGQVLYHFITSITFSPLSNKLFLISFQDLFNMVFITHTTGNILYMNVKNALRSESFLYNSPLHSKLLSELLLKAPSQVLYRRTMCTSPKFLCGSPSPQCDSIRSFDLWEPIRSEFSWLGLVPLCKRPHIAAFPLPWEVTLKLPSMRKQALSRHWTCWHLTLGLRKLQNCEKQVSIVDVPNLGRASLHFAWSVAGSEKGLLCTAGCPHLEALWPGSGVQGVD